MPNYSPYDGDTLMQEVRAYLDSISRVSYVTRPEPGPDVDKLGRPILVDVVQLNAAGEPVEYRDFIEPPTAGDLCRRLGVTRATWWNYSKREDTAPAVELFRDAQQAYLERETLTRRGGDAKGAMWMLSVHYGWTERKEIEIGPNTVQAATLAGMSLHDKAAMLEDLRREAFTLPPAEAVPVPSDAEAEP